MLNFSHKPDEVFTELVTKSLDYAIELAKELDDEEFSETFQYIGEVLPREKAVMVLERLSFCHQMSGVYGINDYHWLLIGDAINLYCIPANSISPQAIIEKTKISQIDIDEVFDYFLPDSFTCPCCLKKQGIPTMEKLDCKLLHQSEYALTENEAPLYCSESKVYPDKEFV
jgi:hypothetical protein